MAIRNFTDLAYSKSVKAMQQHLGARDRNAELEREPRNTEVTEALSACLAERTSILLATAAKSGWPYVQHRGGPKGFVRTLDPHTNFLSPEAYAQMREKQQASFYGLGILVGVRGGRLTVITPIGLLSSSIGTARTLT